MVDDESYAMMLQSAECSTFFTFARQPLSLLIFSLLIFIKNSYVLTN